MRVLELSLRNYRVFEEVDLEIPARVIGIFGENGAGKTTICESIAFAFYGAEAFAVQGGPVVGSLEQEWAAYVEPQDLAGLDRERVVALGSRFLVDAQGETV